MSNRKSKIVTSFLLTMILKLVQHRLLFIILLFAGMGAVKAQILEPVKWSFSAVPVKGKVGVYEVHMIATIDKTWKIYSGSTPEDGPSPTVVKFSANPMVLLGGKVKEIGELHKMPEPAFGVDVWYFKDKVDFVQVVKVKAGILKQVQDDVVLKGTVEFMACDAQQCLPPEEISFSVELK